MNSRRILSRSLPPVSVKKIMSEIGPRYAGSAGGIISTIQVTGAVVIPTFVITPLGGANATVMFGLAAICLALICIPVLFLPELGSRALASKEPAGVQQG